MFDSRKLDAFFDNAQNVGYKKTEKKFGRLSLRRFVKLFLPCVAAALLGLLVVMPNIKKSVDLKDTVTIPHKNEMEKLHLEQTVFNSTDNKNRVNKITADSVDEIKAGTQKYKIINPYGIVPTDSGEVRIKAPVGVFDQNTKILELHKKVEAVIDNNTKIYTAQAIYDFEKEKGYGNLPVKAYGDWGNLNAKAFEYDKAAALLTLKGKNNIYGRNINLSAEDKTLIFQNENKVIAIRKAVVKQNGKILMADKIIGYFDDSGKKELQRAEAYGNVIVKTANEQANAAEGFYNALTGEIILYGSKDKNKSSAKGLVTINQDNTIIKARKIIAYLDKNKQNTLKEAKAYEKVILQKEEEKAFGDEGYYDALNGKIILYGSLQNATKKDGLVRIYKEDNKLQAKKVIAYLSADGKELAKVEAFENVVVNTPKGKAQGNRGLYLPTHNMVELFEDVKIEQNGNFIRGDHAETNLLTSISRINGDKAKGGRISGTFYRKRVVKNGNKK